MQRKTKKDKDMQRKTKKDKKRQKIQKKTKKDQERQKRQRKTKKEEKSFQAVPEAPAARRPLWGLRRSLSKGKGQRPSTM